MPQPPNLTRPHLLECLDCGTVQTLPAMPPNARANCLNCDAFLRHTRADPFTLPLALNFAALVMFIVGGGWTLMSVSTAGQLRDAGLFTGPTELVSFGLWELAVVVLITTFAVPLARILCTLAVLLGLRLSNRPPGIRLIFGLIEHLRPWSMVEIFLLGLFVAYVRLGHIAHIEPGPAVLALAALTVTMLAADVTLDPQAVWEALDDQTRRRPLRSPAAGLLGARLYRIGCHTCGRVTRGREGALCPRCGFALHHRKPNSIARTWALVTAALILYIPANMYPILTVIQFGAGQPSTILEGVRELLENGMWPLAVLVFFASVAVPVLKLVGLILLLLTTQARLRVFQRDRTVLYRILDSIGRWSMIDIFMESILVALVQFGAVATIVPGPGAIAFASVVILTMLAARAFDPRLIWDRAAEAQEGRSPETRSAARPSPEPQPA
jgi:paraquat-inducible protein A